LSKRSNTIYLIYPVEIKDSAAATKKQCKQTDLRNVVALNIKYEFKLGNQFSVKLPH